MSEKELLAILRDQSAQVECTLEKIKELEEGNGRLRDNRKALEAERHDLEEEVLAMHAKHKRLSTESLAPQLDECAKARQPSDPGESDKAMLTTTSLTSRFGQSSDAHSESSEEPPPDTLHVKAQFAKECAGTYVLRSDGPSCGYPVWKQHGGRFHIFGNSDGLVVFGDGWTRKCQCDEGMIASAVAHRGRPPHAIKDWQRDDGADWVLDNTIAVCTFDGSKIEELLAQESWPKNLPDIGSSENSAGSESDSESESDTDDNCPPQRSVTILELPSPEVFMVKPLRRAKTM